MDVRTGLANWPDSTKKAVLGTQDQRLGGWPEPDLHRRLTDETFIAKLWDKLTECERQAACLLLRQAPGGFMRKRDWEQAADAANPRLQGAIAGLCRLGLVFPVTKTWSERGYWMPLDIRDILSARLLVTADRAASPRPGKRTLSYYTPSGRGIQLDLFVCLRTLQDGAVPLTRRGTVPRRLLQQWAGMISLADEHVTCLAAHLAKLEPDIPAAWLVLDLAHRLGLIRVEERQITLALDAMRDWNDAAPSWRTEQLLRVLRTGYLPEEPWLDALVAQLARLEARDWLPLEDWLLSLRLAGYSIPDDAIETARGWLHLLLGCGLVELGEDDSGTLHLRFSGPSDEHTASAWYVEPGGVLLIPPSMPLSRLWELSRIAEFACSGDWLRAELSPARIQASVNEGKTVEGILSFLAESCPYPLPAQVTDDVAEWAGRARRIRLEPAVRVRTNDSRLLQEWSAIPSLQPFLTEVIGETSFLIPPGELAELIRLLRQCGYEPHGEEQVAALYQPFRNTQDDAGVSRADRRFQPMGACRGLISFGRPWEGFQADGTLPAEEQETPAFASLPRMWTAHYQSYHPHTLRDLFQRARDLKLEVVAERDDGGEWRGIPEQVKVEDGYWRVLLTSDGKRHRFRLEEVRRVRILLPDRG